MRRTAIYAHLEPHDRCRCETQATDSHPEGYPVLHIGDIAVFPTVEQLRGLREEIDRWLSAEAATAGTGAGI
jgi:hypothetical protein